MAPAPVGTEERQPDMRTTVFTHEPAAPTFDLLDSLSVPSPRLAANDQVGCAATCWDAQMFSCGKAEAGYCLHLCSWGLALHRWSQSSLLEGDLISSCLEETATSRQGMQLWTTFPSSPTIPQPQRRLIHRCERVQNLNARCQLSLTPKVPPVFTPQTVHSV